MSRPDREPYKGEPEAKFESGNYYRYRQGPNMPWGNPISLPDK
jgi:hypothetical protein